MSKAEANQSAILLAIDKLKDVDFDQRCPALGLPTPVGGKLILPVFGTEMTLDLKSFKMKNGAGKPACVGDLILVLHYLLSEVSIKQTGELISFRNLPGGQFYYGPFRSRTVKPLLGRIGNDMEMLEKHLGRFDFERITGGDYAARIHAFGNLYVDLIYHVGDDEFDAAADIVFDACIQRVFDAENAAVMASRICIGLL
ncbi:hypothetical protein BVY04_01930 [bacterium M21]|nr:hypothetical protein BVY04_01930 [bacterium M21]